jgi:hypothetical protein
MKLDMAIRMKSRCKDVNTIFLLNNDYTMHKKANIQVYFYEEPYNKDVFGNTNVGIMYSFEDDDLQLTTMC